MLEGKIVTVRGPIDPQEITAMVPHEHVVHRFGEPACAAPEYDLDEVDEMAVPALQDLLAAGCNTIADCTTAYFGRAVEILQGLSEKTGVHIITNTGYYGAAEDRYVPQHAYAESAEQIAARWIAEWHDGIEGTDIRPGFIKTAVDSPGPLSEIDAKLVQAAAIAHLSTGLVIESHSPGDGSLAAVELDILEEEGAGPEAWIWVHADSVDDMNSVVDAARRGAWIEFDSVKKENLNDRVDRLIRMKQESLLSRVMLSHDEASYEPGRMRPVPVHITVFRDLIPQLLKNGFDQRDISLLTAENPRNAFAVQVKRAR